MFEPLHRSRPAHRWTYGDLACRVGADLGLPPDAEQQWLLDTIYAEKAPERPASFEVVTIAPRQNIKTSTYGIAALADLFVFGVEKHLWTAHHGDTLADTFGDFRTWIKSNREYEDQVTFYEGHQDMAIVRTDPETGQEFVLDFQSRTGKAGRGVTGVKRVTIDEGLYLEAKHVGAVYPTMLTKPEAQVRVASSAGILASVELRRIRDKGRTGKDGKTGYVEYGAKRRPCLRADCTHKVGAEGCQLDNRALWWEGNCALWSGRIGEEAIENMRNSMPPEEFMREFLSWWEEPLSVGGALDYQTWLELADPDAERGTDVVFGVDVTEDRAAWIAVAWWREDGHAQVMLANDGRSLPAFKLVEECKRLAGEYGGPVVPPKAFEEDLDEAGVEVLPTGPGDFVIASGDVADALEEQSIRHGNQPALNDAVRAAVWRSAGPDGARAFQLKDMPQVGPLAATARALRGLNRYQSGFAIY